jgi:hypothetical protein
MSKRKFYGCMTVFSAVGAAFAVMASVTSVQAGGGFSEPTYSGGGSSSAQQSGDGQTGSSSKGTTVYSSPNVNYSSTSTADAGAIAENGVNGAAVAVGAAATVELNGAGSIDQTSDSKTTVFSKNGGVLAKGRSETVTTVTVGGQKILVVDDVAKAAARSTPFGSSSATGTDLNVYSDGAGYAGGAVSTDKTIRSSK